MNKRSATILLLASTFFLLLFFGNIIFAFGQEAGGPPPPPPPDGGSQSNMDMPPPFRPHRPPMEQAFRDGLRGRWWDNSDLARNLNLTADQQKKMDEIFLQSRLSLIDLMANVKKQEVIMEPLLSADQPDEAKILAQIDRVAQARAKLEKANARMLLGLRRVLTPEQWQKLHAEGRQMRGQPGPHGPEDWRESPAGL